jgi:large subunit ribosomal protein L4
VTFGPHPHSYNQRIPKKMRRLALKCVLSAKAQEGQLVVVKELALENPNTRQMAEVLKALKTNASTLIITEQAEGNIIKSARNIKGARTLPVALLNVLDLLSYKSLVMTLPAVRKAEQIWAAKAAV